MHNDSFKTSYKKFDGGNLLEQNGNNSRNPPFFEPSARPSRFACDATPLESAESVDFGITFTRLFLYGNSEFRYAEESHSI